MLTPAPRTPWTRHGLLALSLVAAAAPAAAEDLEILGPKAPLRARGQFTFRVKGQPPLPGSLETKQTLPPAAAAAAAPSAQGATGEPWPLRWAIFEGPGRIHAKTGEYQAPDRVDRSCQVIITVNHERDATKSGILAFTLEAGLPLQAAAAPGIPAGLLPRSFILNHALPTGPGAAKPGSAPKPLFFPGLDDVKSAAGGQPVPSIPHAPSRPGSRPQAQVFDHPADGKSTTAGLAAPAVLPSQPGPKGKPAPFLDPATGRRGGEGKATVFESTRAWDAPPVRAGYGVPFRMPLPAAPGAGWARRCWTRLGAQWRPLELLGGDLVQGLRGRSGVFRLETLKQAEEDTWDSLRHDIPVDIRGMALFAGRFESKGHQDAAGDQARFAEPYGLALVKEGKGTGAGLLVTEPVSHVLRLAAPDGTVRTLAGKAGDPGFQDGAGEHARLNQPSFVLAPCAAVPGARQPLAIFSDSGNQVLRALHEDGEVELLAGTPTVADHQDGPMGEALFSNPRGLAQDPAGNLYVADAGNRVIRVITPDGQVDTLAGTPGADPGHQDGMGPAAQFRALEGLAFDPVAGLLYIVDGHAIRRLNPATRWVTTVVGAVDARGFRDALQGGAQALLAARLADPCGLQWDAETGLHIADFGNQAVRVYHPGDETLRTLVGDPGLTVTRAGLLRDGMEEPPDADYAALAAPRTLALDRGPSGVSLFVTSGHSVWDITCRDTGRDRLSPLTLVAVPPEARGGFFLLKASAATTDADGKATVRPLTYTFDLQPANGLLPVQMKKTDAGKEGVIMKSRVHISGELDVVVRCVTDQGVSVAARTTLVLP